MPLYFRLSKPAFYQSHQNCLPAFVCPGLPQQLGHPAIPYPHHAHQGSQPADMARFIRASKPISPFRNFSARRYATPSNLSPFFL